MKKAFLLILALTVVFAFSATALAADVPYTDGCITWTLPEGTTSSGGIFTSSISGTVTCAITNPGYETYTLTKVSYTRNGGTAIDDSDGVISVSAGSTYVMTPYYTVGVDPTEIAGDAITLYVESDDTSLDSVTFAGGTTVKSGDTYTVHVDTGTTSGNIVATAYSTATVEIQVGEETPISHEHSATWPLSGLTSASYPVNGTITVTAENGDEDSYTLHIYNDKDVASLTNLTNTHLGNLHLDQTNHTVTGDLVLPTSADNQTVTFTAAFTGGTIANGSGSEDNCSIGTIIGKSIPVTIKDISDGTAVFDLEVTALDGTTKQTYTVTLDLFAVGDFSGVSMKITGSDGDTYFNKSEFDADDTTYIVNDLDDSLDYVTLYVYYDDDAYSVSSVKYGGSTSRVHNEGYSTRYGYRSYEIEVNPASLKDITVTMLDKAGNAEETYTFDLTSTSGDFASIDMKLVGSDGKTYLNKNDFDPDDTSYTVDDLDDSVTYVNLYIYYDDADNSISSVKYDNSTSGVSSKDYSGYRIYKIKVNTDDLSNITVVMKDNYNNKETYTIDLKGGNSLTSMYLYGSSGGTITMSPVFNATEYNYVASVANSVSSMYIYTATDGATVKVSQNSGSYLTKSSNTTAYYLNEGLNTFDILVGSTHYYLNVYRTASAMSIVASSQYISVDGSSASRIAAYNINGNNFVKLRDLAKLLSGSDKQFSVSYSAATNIITLKSGYAYVSVGGELTIPTTYTHAVASPQRVYLDSAYVYPMAYNIDGNNYYLLRDLAVLFDFKITYSGATVYIDTDYGFNGEASSSSGDFDGVGMKVTDSEGKTCLAKSDFDPDDTSYDVEISDDADYVYLYVYYDKDDYTVSSVKYDNSTSDVTDLGYSSNSEYSRYKIKVDDLDDITVKIKNDDGDYQTYTLSLDVD